MLNGRDNKHTITQETGTGSFVKTNKTEVTHNPHGGALWRIALFCHFSLNLQANLHNFKRIREDDLACTSRTTSK